MNIILHCVYYNTPTISSQLLETTILLFRFSLLLQFIIRIYIFSFSQLMHPNFISFNWPLSKNINGV